MTSSLWYMLRDGYYALVFFVLWWFLGLESALFFMAWVLA